MKFGSILHFAVDFISKQLSSRLFPSRLSHSRVANTFPFGFFSLGCTSQSDINNFVKFKCQTCLSIAHTHTYTHKTPIQPITIAPAISNPMIIPAVYCFVFQLPERFIRQIENHSKSLLHIQHFFLSCWTQFKRSFARKTNIQLNNNLNFNIRFVPFKFVQYNNFVWHWNRSVRMWLLSIWAHW